MTTGWNVLALAEACGIKPPKSEAKQRLSYTDLVSFIPMEDLGIDQMLVSGSQKRELSDVVGSYTYFADGDVLLAKITPCFENGKLGIARNLTNGVGFGSSEYIVFRPGPRLDARWLYYYLSRDSFRSEGGARMGGAVGHKRVAKEFIESYPIPLPPLSEQQRIVAILDEAFAGIATAKANAEKNLQNAREVFVGYLDALLDACDDVEVRRLGDLATRLTNGYVGPIKNVYVESGIPYLLARHVRDNKLAFDGKTFITDEFNQKNRKSILKIGDVLLVQSGHIGHSAVVTEEHKGHNCHAMIVITPVEGMMTGEFLSLLFNSAKMRSEFDAIRSGSTVPHLTCKEVREMAIKLPKVAMQKRLVAQSKELQAETKRLESLNTRKLAALDALKQSLLHQAFSGQL